MSFRRSRSCRSRLPNLVHRAPQISLRWDALGVEPLLADPMNLAHHPALRSKTPRWRDPWTCRFAPKHQGARPPVAPLGRTRAATKKRSCHTTCATVPTLVSDHLRAALPVSLAQDELGRPHGGEHHRTARVARLVNPPTLILRSPTTWPRTPTTSVVDGRFASDLAAGAVEPSLAVKTCGKR